MNDQGFQVLPAGGLSDEASERAFADDVLIGLSERRLLAGEDERLRSLRDRLELGVLALLAKGLSEEDAHCAVRFSLGSATSAEDIDDALTVLARVMKESLTAVRFVSCR
jgi:hypothetical protein